MAGVIAAKPVEIVDGRVRSEAIEISAVRHCNISCRSCMHGSPSMAASFIEVGQVEKDLTTLAQWMDVEHVRVLGGEPLLHPELPELLRAVERSGVTGNRRVLTNGLHLAKQPDAFWNEVDEVHVSVYPNTSRHLERARQELADIAERTDTIVHFKYFDHFRIAFRRPDDHPELTQKVYETCQIANRWRCLTADSGRLHRCPQAMLTPAMEDAIADSLSIEEIDSTEALRTWLLNPQALRSCASCAGSIGVRRPHAARVPGDVDIFHDSLDLAYLAELCLDSDADSGCVTADELC
jgi:organic radical activating enzyme